MATWLISPRDEKCPKCGWKLDVFGSPFENSCGEDDSFIYKCGKCGARFNELGQELTEPK